MIPFTETVIVRGLVGLAVNFSVLHTNYVELTLTIAQLVPSENVTVRVFSSEIESGKFDPVNVIKFPPLGLRSLEVPLTELTVSP